MINILGQGFYSRHRRARLAGWRFRGTKWSHPVTIVSDTYMLVTVPAGARSGFVTVQEPSGNLVTREIFKITMHTRHVSLPDPSHETRGKEERPVSLGDWPFAVNVGLIRRRLFFGLFEGERGGVDAVAEAGGTRAVGEDVAQVAAAAGAGDFNPAHAEGVVFVLVDGFGVGGDHEAGPAAAGIEFGSGQEQQLAAAGAVIIAGFVILGQGAGVGALGAFFAQNVILLRGQRGAPLSVGLDHFFRCLRHTLTSGITHVC